MQDKSGSEDVGPPASASTEPEVQANEETSQLKQVESLEAALQESEDRLLRLQAEFLNFKRRVEKEKSDLHSYGCENLAKDLLPVLDNFERALESVQEADPQIYKGIEMIHQQMIEALKKHDITEIEALGQPFDMHQHHAVMTEETTEEEQKNSVALVMQKGYRMKSRVLRPSMVKVYQ
ncbi:molecular chaperone GrpE [Anoxynatronum buryatiense]|uniref:Protein GrpE n=2 Tax=Anoxynatronum buryatiense TaxID=489973 RepID=A0AA45WT16_9CLOT|nr:molecular chaperone GrpE [Anoxynatronum buryatiense]